MTHRAWSCAMTVYTEIVPATLADAAGIAAIYAHHAIHGTATWETTAPDTAEIAARMERILANGWPWLVARDDHGVLLGYAYAGPYHARAGYRYTCENSIYLRHDRTGRGIGTRLLEALLDASAACGFRQMIAVIAGNEPASIALHSRFGFVEAGRLHGVGRKHGQWLDVIYMQRALGEGSGTPPPVEP